MNTSQIFAYGKKILILKRLHWVSYLFETGFLVILIYLSFRSAVKDHKDSNGAIIILFYVLFGSILQGLYQDKSNKMKELLKITGLDWKSYFAAYFVVEFCIGFGLSIVVCYFLHSLKGYDLFQMATCCVIMLIFLANAIGLAFLIPTLVSNQRFGSFIGFLMYVFPMTAFELLMDTTRPAVYYAASSLLPHASFFRSLEHVYAGHTLASIAVARSLGMQLIPLAAAWILFAYLEQVLPSPVGVSKSPLFFLNRNKRANGVPKLDEEEQRRLGSAFIKVEEVSKRFGQFCALRDVSLEMYTGEIFSILGPNGAGKTTLINMLLGLGAPSAGHIRGTSFAAMRVVNGNDIEDDIELVRARTGYCPQETILFDELTPAQHIELFERIKGAHSHSAAGEEILRRLYLTESRDKQTKLLSGGQRRKLAVGLSFIGSSNLIVLDEPTVGMDADSRQGLWQLIAANKQSRLIILTTQNLEEADELASRICILNAGGIVDRPQPPIEWKKKYGFGYKLVVEQVYPTSHAEPSISGTDPRSSGILDRIKQIVPTHVERAVLFEEKERGKLEFGLPVTEQPRYAAMFSELERYRGVKLSLEYSTLEDAYLNIAQLDRHSSAQPLSDPSQSSGTKLFAATSGSDRDDKLGREVAVGTVPRAVQGAVALLQAELEKVD